MKKKLLIIIPAVIILITAIALYGMKEYNRTNADTTQLKPDYTLSARDLYRQFETNEEAANKKLNDKVLSVNGIITNIESTDSVTKVLLGVEGAPGGIICEFNQTHAKDITGMKEGNSVTIKGICTGMLIDVILVRCTKENNTNNY